MKKVKIMLIAITVLATAGGVLAFQANSVKSAGYCTAATVDDACEDVTCPDGSTITRKTILSGQTPVCYTTTTGSSCNNLECTVRGFTANE